MSAIPYLIKVTLLSGLLYGYYCLALRNKPFHAYNRLYLLGTVLLSLLLPFIPIPEGLTWPGAPLPGPTGILSALIPGNGEDPMVLTAAQGKTRVIGYGELLLPAIYLLGAALFLFNLLRGLFTILRLSARSPMTYREGIRCYLTEAPGTPFSFFNRIFWNSRLDPESEDGRQVFRHERVHIRERHTLDLLFLQLIRCCCWCNPFFHLILRELKTLHEFLADRHAVEGGDRHRYAELLVWQGYHPNPVALTHSFFNTHLKRRITMITSPNRKGSGTLVRVLALPMLAVFFVLLAATTSGRPSGNPAGHTPATDSTHKINPVVRQYLHHLRYPDAALNAQREQTIWFTVKIGPKGELLNFQSYESAPVASGKTLYEIVVTSLPKRFPAGEGTILTEENMSSVFIREARKASENMQSLGSDKAFQPGEYLIKIIFRLEKKPGTDNSMSVSIEENKKM